MNEHATERKPRQLPLPLPIPQPRRGTRKCRHCSRPAQAGNDFCATCVAYFRDSSGDEQ